VYQAATERVVPESAVIDPVLLEAKIPAVWSSAFQLLKQDSQDSVEERHRETGMITDLGRCYYSR